jgi:hypothetical protein
MKVLGHRSEAQSRRTSSRAKFHSVVRLGLFSNSFVSNPGDVLNYDIQIRAGGCRGNWHLVIIPWHMYMLSNLQRHHLCFQKATFIIDSIASGQYSLLASEPELNVCVASYQLCCKLQVRLPR